MARNMHIDTQSPLYSEDLAPIPVEERTWGLWDMTAIWIGMAVCIPTYLLASYMIKSGLNWIEALVIIALGNLIITIPMVLNGHAGVKYGLPFPVLGRASFGTSGIHLAALVRGIVACGWFGIQTWIGGLAFYAIWHVVQGTAPSTALDSGKFAGFALFWLLNVYFILKGTESIKWLEKFAAPILILIGLVLLVWGTREVGSFSGVLHQSSQLAQPSAVKSPEGIIGLFPIKDKDGMIKASSYGIGDTSLPDTWIPLTEYGQTVEASMFATPNNSDPLIYFKNDKGHVSSGFTAVSQQPKRSLWDKSWAYLLWLTAMVGFWATMAISIADITRFTQTQHNQRMGQFLGLPGTMALFSFVGIFVTCAALVIFPDVMIADDAPWDPVSLIGKFQNPMVVVIAQVFMIIATLSTNIAANVIAPANAFSNVWPSRITFRTGGLITAFLGIVICPWLLLDEISNLLLFVSSFLGPVLAILLCDYYIIRKTEINVPALYDHKGIYGYDKGINSAAMWALASGVATALVGIFIPALSFLYTLSWFSGFVVAFGVYAWLMRKPKREVIEI